MVVYYDFDYYYSTTYLQNDNKIQKEKKKTTDAINYDISRSVSIIMASHRVSGFGENN